MLRLICPGRVAVYWPLPSADIASRVRVSPNAFMFSRKYSICTFVSEAVLENEHVTFTVLPARMIVALSVVCTTE